MNPPNRSLVLTQYPLLRDQREEFERQIDCDVEYLVVSTFTPHGHFGLIRYLRKLKRPRVYIMLGEDVAMPMYPILSFLSLWIETGQRHVIKPDLSIVDVKLSDYFLNAFSLTGAILAGLLNLCTFGFCALVLKYSPRVRVKPDTITDQLAYLRTNLWLGVQAGGALSHARGVILAALSRGRKVFVLAPDSKGVSPQDGYRLERVLPNHAYIVPRELNHFSYNRYFLARAESSLSGFKGIIYQRTSLGSLAGVLISRRYKLPLVLEYNGSEIWMARNWGTPFLFGGVIRLIENISLRQAHAVVTVSNPLRDDLISKGVNPKRIIVVPNGVNPEEFDSEQYAQSELDKLRSLHGIAPDAVLVTFVGTFGPWHGVEVLAKAAYEMSKNPHEDRRLHFMFIGDGASRPEVERITSSLVEPGMVTLTGLVAQSEIGKYLAASDILVSPTVMNPDKSPFFGSPTKLFEYMAAGRPVIASRIGQVGEICSDCRSVTQIVEGSPLAEGSGEFGVTVEPGNVQQLATAIQYAASNQAWREQAGRTARRVVIERYTWEKHYEAIEQNTDVIVRRTRVLVNALHSRSGGGITYLMNIVPRLAAMKDLDVHIVLHTDQLPVFASVLDNVVLHEVEFKRSFWNLMTFEQLAVPRIEREIDADAVYSPANYGPIFCRNSVLLLRNALSVVFVERRLGKILYWAALFAGTALSVMRAKAVVAVSEYSKRSAAGGVMSIFSKGVDIIPHGVNEIFSPGPIDDRDDDELLAVSDLYLQKNLHTLLTALSKLAPCFPSLKLSIAGAPIDSAYAQRLKNMTEKLGLSSKVRFLGSVQPGELSKLYQKCTVFVFPSTVETFGNPLVEAMACGCAVATSRTAAMPEIAGDAANYFDPNDVDDMVNVIANMLSDHEVRRQLGERAKTRAQRYSWDRNAEELFHIFDRLNRR